jgi:hypothetical protein
MKAPLKQKLSDHVRRTRETGPEAAMAKVRRNKALRCIADYRQSLAKQVKQSTDRILDGDEVPRFVAVRKRSD